MGAVIKLAAAAAGSYITSGLGSGAFGGGFITSLLNAGFPGGVGFLSQIGGFIVSTAISQIGSRIGTKQPKAPSFTQDASGRALAVRSTVESHKIIYGTTKVSGPIVYITTVDNGPDYAGAQRTGLDNYFLHMIIPVAGHEIEDITEFYLGDQRVTIDANGFVLTSPFFSDGQSFARIKKHLGAADQAADADLVAEVPQWTAAHRLRGIAYIYLRLQWNDVSFPGGIPNLSVVVKGKKVYDPRSTLTAWSNNWALCVRDYMTSDYGFGCSSDEIDDAYFIAAANISDENVTLADATTQDRYTCDGLLDTATSPLENLDQLRTGGAGFITYVQGKFRLHAAAYDSPVGSFTDSMLAGDRDINVRTPRKELFNAVKGTFVDPNKSYQPTDFPAVVNATYQTQDGEQIFRDIELPFTNHPERAQRVAKIILEKSRQGLIIEQPMNYSALKYAVGDVITITNDAVGWSAKPFRILKWQFSPNGGVVATLQEESSASYDWNSGDATIIDPAPDTNLPDPFSVAEPQGVAADSGNTQLFVAGDGTIVSRILLTWSATTNSFVRDGGSVQVQFKKSVDTEWQDTAALLGNATQTFISPVEDGVAYDLRVRFRNNLRYPSEWTQISHIVIGKTELPSDITLFTIEGNRLSWNHVTDLDVAGYLIRFQPGTSQSWGNAVPMHTGFLTSSPFDMTVSPSGLNTIMIKAVDTTGNESQNPAFIVTNLGDPDVANIVETFDRKASGWPGTLTNGTIDGSNNLVADSSGSMWNTDDQAAMWSGDPSTPMWAPPLYEQMIYIDGIDVTEALAGSTLTLATTIAGDTWTIEYRSIGTSPMWAVDDTTPMWSTDSGTLMWGVPDWQPWPGSIIAENAHYDFRITTSQGQTQGVISEFTITVDAPDIDEAFNNQVILAGGTRLTLTKTFQVLSNIQLTLQTDGGTAVTARIEDRDAALGPLIKCYNAAGVSVDGTIDARIKGY